MSDRLILHDVQAQCRIGVFGWEREKPQPIWIDLELAIDAARAARRDEVRDAVDYARLVDVVKRVAEGSTFNLMETLAEQIAATILQEFATPRVVARVKKRALPGVDYAAVEVERTRRTVRVGERRSRRALAPR